MYVTAFVLLYLQQEKFRSYQLMVLFESKLQQKGSADVQFSPSCSSPPGPARFGAGDEQRSVTGGGAADFTAASHNSCGASHVTSLCTVREQGRAREPANTLCLQVRKRTVTNTKFCQSFAFLMNAEGAGQKEAVSSTLRLCP